eukprot:2584090-Rhodomonas_salina.1
MMRISLTDLEYLLLTSRICYGIGYSGDFVRGLQVEDQCAREVSFATILCACYAMSGTDLAYGGSVGWEQRRDNGGLNNGALENGGLFSVRWQGFVRTTVGGEASICYLLSGTDVGYDATQFCVRQYYGRGVE